MEAEGRVPGPALPAGGEGPGTDSHLAAGALGTARGPLLAAAEVLALDDEEDDLEVFSKVRRRPPRRGWPGGLAGTLPQRAPGGTGRDGTGGLRPGGDRGLCPPAPRTLGAPRAPGAADGPLAHSAPPGQRSAAPALPGGFSGTKRGFAASDQQCES